MLSLALRTLLVERRKPLQKSVLYILGRQGNQVETLRVNSARPTKKLYGFLLGKASKARGFVISRNRICTFDQSAKVLFDNRFQ